GVQGKGTYFGMMQKIPYLKELGITALELLPAYEFEEVEVHNQHPSIQYMIDHYKDIPSEENPEEASSTSLNYWGFKKGYYFAPKASYAYAHTSRGAMIELKNLIHELHQNNMELIMQFYFPSNMKQGYILEVLKYWVLEYHIDGIHLLGEHIPVTLIATEPLFSNTKLLYYDFPCDEIYEKEEQPVYRNLASYQDDFMYDVRKFLKSDEDTLAKFVTYMKKNPSKEAKINYITNYYGFTLQDCVSYDQKHNEANGEDNKDGNNYNYSWNCGVEGATRKRSIQDLRLQQMKNALLFVILAQGTPLLQSGDEFGNSQKGNNNPYCQDNAISWLNWNDLAKHTELFSYTKQLLAIRKAHPILRQPQELRIMDTLSCGYPDLSYHGEEVWRPILDNYNRHIGIMYCGKYAKLDQNTEDDFFYIAYNMHWLEHSFALPKLPKGMQWKLILSTAAKSNQDAAVKEESVLLAPRSIHLYQSTQIQHVNKQTIKHKKSGQK
ncbi:MAG: alpha-amylase family glycosyl hydrolase, partial [Lachnospiraceae bacterium]